MCRKRLVGLVLAISGGAIVLAIILPSDFWWLIVGLVLLALGLFVIKK